jgi:hypothetical protein
MEEEEEDAEEEVTVDMNLEDERGEDSDKT